MAQTLQKHFEFEVNANEVSGSFRLLEDVDFIHSMQLSASDMGKLYDEGISFEMTLDGREVLPPDQPVKPYLADPGVPVQERFSRSSRTTTPKRASSRSTPSKGCRET